jgi:hypothetical protein
MPTTCTTDVGAHRTDALMNETDAAAAMKASAPDVHSLPISAVMKACLVTRLLKCIVKMLTAKLY